MAEVGQTFMWINEKLHSPGNGEFLDFTDLNSKSDTFLDNHTNNVEVADLR
jgi:hypothetical protein